MHDPLPLLLVGTTNAGKVREFRDLLVDLPARVVFPNDLGIDLEVEEGETSFHQNARLKARAFMRASGVLTIGEDSGFEVDAMGGAPGVISARWGGSDYGVKNRRIIDTVAGLRSAQRGCRYVSIIAVATPDGRIFQRTGELRGQVAKAPAGSGGFGYDPIFLVPDRGRTLAELSPAEKHAISHRGRAVAKALPLLRSLLTAAGAPNR